MINLSQISSQSCGRHLLHLNLIMEIQCFFLGGQVVLYRSCKLIVLDLDEHRLIVASIDSTFLKLTASLPLKMVGREDSFWDGLFQGVC